MMLIFFFVFFIYLIQLFFPLHQGAARAQVPESDDAAATPRHNRRSVG
jgi:hypothetical protein